MITDLTTSWSRLRCRESPPRKKKIDIVVGAATSAISGSACTPYGFHWAFDTHALAVSTGGALVKAGGDTWYFVTVDYAFGHALEKDTSAVIEADGGKVLGRVALSPQRPGLLVLPLAGAKLQGQGRRPRRRRNGHREFYQAGGGIRLLSPAASGLRRY